MLAAVVANGVGEGWTGFGGGNGPYSWTGFGGALLLGEVSESGGWNTEKMDDMMFKIGEGAHSL